MEEESTMHSCSLQDVLDGKAPFTILDVIADFEVQLKEEQKLLLTLTNPIEIERCAGHIHTLTNNILAFKSHLI